MPGHACPRSMYSNRLSRGQNRYGAHADWCAYWRNLANTTEPSVCGGDAALCQITLTTCYYYYSVSHIYNTLSSLI